MSAIVLEVKSRSHGCRNYRLWIVNALVQQKCNEVKLYYVHLWNSFVSSENMFMRDGLHLSGRVYGFFADNFNRTFDSGLKNENYLKYIVLFLGL